MKTLRLCVCLLVLSTLSIFGGCKKEKGSVAPKVVPVAINNCNPNPDPVSVHEGDKIDWETGDGRDYTIQFIDPNEPTPNPFPVKHGGSNPAHLIKGHNRCDPDKSGKGYYCKYSVTSPATADLPACTNDPGVHIQ
jgi:hypothetical protein